MDYTIGSITVKLLADEDGQLLVHTSLSGELQYVMATGMLEMAKDSLSEILGDSEDD